MSDRKHHRLTTGELSNVSVVVALFESDSLDGELVDLSPVGVGVRFTDDSADQLRVGQVLRLRFSGPAILEPIDTPARVQYVNEATKTTRLRCGFLLLEPTRFERCLSSSLRARFNRRKMTRVSPDESTPVWVRIMAVTPGGEVVKARGDLVDISGIGLGVALESDAAGPFDDVNLVYIRMRLPLLEAELNLTGWVRYRLRLVSTYRFGIEFDPGRTEDFNSQQALILRYVQERQRELTHEGGAG